MVACPRCGTENADTAKFCQECATPLAAAAERRERRVVTVLFADLAGFTSRSERLDVEDVHEFLAPYLALLRAEVERTGGVVAKFTGDGVLALFGAVVAHEDDAERAVRAGLGICEGVAQLGDDQLHVRVGVTTGEVLVVSAGSSDVDAIGDVVNTAARLESGASKDTVLVDAYTYRVTEREVRYRAAAAVVAKGKSEPVEVWQAIEPLGPAPKVSRLDGAVMVGRAAEIRVLQEALETAFRHSLTQLVVLLGEAGIGKSRLVEELHHHARSLTGEIKWRRGRSLSYGEPIAFWALGEIVKGEAGILESDGVESAGGKLKDVVAGLIEDVADREWVLEHLRPLVGLGSMVGLSAEGGRVEAFAAWRRFVEALAGGRPSVLVFEDLHWADDALLDFIELLARLTRGVPLLILCTARPELLERRRAWGESGDRWATVELSSLSATDTARVVADLLHQAALPSQVQDALVDRAGGNPLYAREYVRMLQDRGLLSQRADGWALRGDAGGLPESIQGIIAARLDTLTREEKSLIQDAAVVGRTAWVGATRALTERDAWQSEELLRALERKQLVRRERRSSIRGETEFRFAHALTQDVTYGQIRRGERAQKHEAAAAWIEQLAGDRDDKAELLADHYQKALVLRRALGQDTSTLAPKACEAFAEAGRQASATHAHLVAARHYAAALELIPDGHIGQRAELLLGQATALFKSDTADDVLLRTAAAAQVAAGEWEAAARAEWMVSMWYEFHDVSGEQREAHLALAAQYAARVHPTDTMCMVATDRAMRRLFAGRAEEALDLVVGALPVAEHAGLEIGRAILLATRGLCRTTIGDRGGIDDLRRGAEALAQRGHAWTATGYLNLVEALRAFGPMQDADEACTAAAHWAAPFANVVTLDSIAGEQAYQRYHAADWEAALQLLDDLDTTNVLTSRTARIVRAHICLARGHITQALDEGLALEDWAAQAGVDDYSGVALQARCHAAQGRRIEALAACDRFLRRWHDAGGYAIGAVELCEIAPLLAAEGRTPQIREAAVLLPEASNWRTALLSIAEGRYSEAAVVYERNGSEPLAADAHLLAATRSHDHDDTVAAHHHTQAVKPSPRRPAQRCTTSSARAFSNPDSDSFPGAWCAASGSSAMPLIGSTSQPARSSFAAVARPVTSRIARSRSPRPTTGPSSLGLPWSFCQSPVSWS